MRLRRLLVYRLIGLMDFSSLWMRRECGMGCRAGRLRSRLEVVMGILLLWGSGIGKVRLCCLFVRIVEREQGC